MIGTRGYSAVEGLYRSKTRRSEALWRRATGIMPMGVSASSKYFAPYPPYLERAEGGRVWDIDNNEYIDLIMGAGPHILGHRDVRVMEAVHRQLDAMTQSLAPTRLEVELAERLASHMVYLERVRFANTGSEAIRSAIRAARAYTGRTMIAKFEGHYHGSDDPVMVSAGARQTKGPADRPVGVPESAGIPAYIISDTLVLPFNDVAASVHLLDEAGDRVAAVLMEPVGFSSGGAIPADRELAAAVRSATNRHGAVLIFDEVVTGLRLGLGGAPTFLGVSPDLSCVGKAIGGGFPLAAFGGRAEIMETVMGPASDSTGQRIFHSGTFTANPVPLAAGLAVLDVLESEPVLEHVDRLASRLRNGLEKTFRQHEVAACTTGMGSIFQVHFTARPPTNRRETLTGDLSAVETFLLGMVAEGILWSPIHSGLTAYAHKDADIDRAIAAADRVLATMADRADG